MSSRADAGCKPAFGVGVAISLPGVEIASAMPRHARQRRAYGQRSCY
ncbi:MAG: hypothetical protein ISS57_17770 [Anaerolineales bacterium]|nr:hypothetical protein [Anaerolineales bacterium]